MTNNGSLIIGDGIIGCALAKLLRSKGEPFVITSRNIDRATSTCFLDLKDLSSFSIPKGIKTAYICAGVSLKSNCEENLSTSRIINVTNTMELAKSLSNKNIFVVFLSSAEVFSGRKPKYDINDLPNPESAYGKLKVETECALKKLEKNFSVIRLTKVLDRKSGIASMWIKRLQDNQPINAFNDIYISPVSLKYATEFIYSVGDSQNPGIYHLSGDKDYSYYDIAKMLAHRTLSNTLLVSGSAADIEMPTYASLSMQNNSNSDHFKPQPINSVLESLFSE